MTLLPRKPGRPFYRYTFPDGETHEIDAESVKAQCASQRKRLSHAYGKLGGKPSKFSLEVKNEIFLLFFERLFGAEKYAARFGRAGLRARNAARAWIVNQIAGRYAVSEREARRWITETLGPAHRKSQKK